jgi:glycosyltransferase involved in cell wall biosynthesis
MRVGFDARWYNGSWVGTYVAELLNAFDERPDEFELVVYEDPKNRVPTTIHSRASFVPIRSSRFSLAGQIELRALCKSEHLDLLHSPFQHSAPLFLSCPLVVTVHDLIPLLFRTRSWLKQLLAMPLVNFGYRAAALRAEHVIADSVNTARDVEAILKVPASKITAVHLAASSTSFHSRTIPGETQELFVRYGVQSPYAMVASAGCNWRTKNLEAALGALAIGRRRSGINFQTVVFGPGDGIANLSNRSLTSELNIRRVGYLPVIDLGALFRNAELFIMPSLYEGFGLPILEAMSCGCPVLTSNAGSLAEVAGQGARTFAPSDVEGMGEAVACLVSCPQERDKWRRFATTRAADFSWKRTASETAAVYRKVCNNPSVLPGVFAAEDSRVRTQL